MSHEQNLSTTSGAPEFVAQYFPEIPASGIGIYDLDRRGSVTLSLQEMNGLLWKPFVGKTDKNNLLGDHNSLVLSQCSYSKLCFSCFHR
jgi:hypothetical protein